MSKDKFRKDLVKAYIENQEKGTKNVEVALQDVIEERYPDKCWWEVCDVPIFMRLLEGVKANDLIDEIVNTCNK